MSNTSSNYSTATGNVSSASDTFITIVYDTIYTISTTGLVGALLILSLSTFSSKLKGDFKYFVCNMAFIDLFTEATWLAYLLAVNYYTAVSLVPLPLIITIWISLYAGYLAALTAPLPAIISRFVILRKHTGMIQYRRFFSKKCILIYVIICDLYPYLLVFMAAMLPFPEVQMILNTIYMTSFVIIYFFVTIISVTLYRVLKNTAADEARLQNRHEPALEKKQVAKAFLYLGFVPLCCQFFHLLYAIVYIYAQYWGKDSTEPIFLYIHAFLNNVILLGLVVNPVIDVIVVFAVMKPYKIALLSALKVIYCKWKPHETDVNEAINLEILQADRYVNRRPTFRSTPIVLHAQ